MYYLVMVMRVLISGSKEYPMGSNKGDDPIPSGGMETYVGDLAPELSKHCELLIVTRKFNGTKRYEKNGNIEVYRTPYVKGKYFRNPSYNFISFLTSLGLARKFDIIYSQGLIASFFGYFISKMAGKRLICRPAGIANDYPFPVNRILDSLMKTIYSRCDLVIFHSDGEKNNFASILGFSPKSEIILTGIPVEKFSAPAKSTKHSFGISEKTHVIGFIGRFVEVKGIEYLIKAASLMKEKDVRFLMVGDGPQKPQIESLIRSLGLKEKFIFAGFRRDIPNVLAAMDTFVISSTSEGLPTSLLEAMAARKACVVTDIGLPIENRKTGLVVPPKNPERLADALKTLTADKKLRELLGHNAQKFVMENCTLEKAAKRHVEVFGSL
jgi:glycosyltransferase involved in cell wall biosynthesis